jgi:hypothetical protein
MIIRTSSVQKPIPRNGRDRFHSVPIFTHRDGDAVERVPTGFMAPMRDLAIVDATQGHTGVCSPAFRLPWRRSDIPYPPGQAKACTTNHRFTEGRPRAFTLVEVLIAIGLFFMVSFAVLEIVMVGLGAARSLQMRHADVGMLAAELAATNNILEEGTASGDFSDYFPGARWERNVEEVGSNGLFRVDFVVIQKVGKSENVSDTSILLYRPGSPKGRMSGGTGQLTGPQPVQ